MYGRYFTRFADSTGRSSNPASLAIKYHRTVIFRRGINVLQDSVVQSVLCSKGKHQSERLAINPRLLPRFYLSVTRNPAVWLFSCHRRPFRCDRADQTEFSTLGHRKRLRFPSNYASPRFNRWLAAMRVRLYHVSYNICIYVYMQQCQLNCRTDRSATDIRARKCFENSLITHGTKNRKTYYEQNRR